MRNVNDFIQLQTGDFFFGNHMMVAEWRQVPEWDQRFVSPRCIHIVHNIMLIIFCSQSITNTFQGILITDGISSYAVFIYECGGMEWGEGVIGWQQSSSSRFDWHFLSGMRNSTSIGCLYSSTYSAVVYKVACKYSMYMYTYIHVCTMYACTCTCTVSHCEYDFHAHCRLLWRSGRSPHLC